MAEWEGRAHEGQLPPPGDWSSWLFLGGRGAGKTRAGAEWLSSRAVRGARLALVGPSLHDVREVMIEGPSGLIAIAPPWRRPELEISRRRLVWPSGAQAYLFSAEDPDSLRGPQFHAAWADEFTSWRRGAHTLAMLRMGLRLGESPQLCVTTTPRASEALKALIAEPGTVTSHAPSHANARNLSPNFLRGLEALYGGTRLAAQELEGALLEGEGALWSSDTLRGCRGQAPGRFDEIVVGLDPPAGSSGAACGIVVAGRLGDVAWVLEDASVEKASPMTWARRVSRAVEAHGADAVVAEVNQGGEMVGEMLRMALCKAPVRAVRASTSKLARAAPVAALYEQGRVFHAARFALLETELMGMGTPGVRASPDRADALVWAISDLLLGTGRGRPRVRAL